MTRTASHTHRIGISGIGLCTPLGPTRKSTWDNLCAEQSGLDWLQHPFTASGGRDLAVSRLGVQAGGRIPQAIPNHEPLAERRLSREQAANGSQVAQQTNVTADDIAWTDQDELQDPIIRWAQQAAWEAWRDARLDQTPADPQRIGCVIGSSKGGLHSAARMLAESASDESQAALVELWEQVFPNSPAAQISRQLGIHGVTHCPIAACATGMASLFQAEQLIRNDVCDVVLAGSVDASLQPALLNSFARLGVLARDFDEPSAAVRPFQTARNGFLVGEGAAVLVLERLDSALQRSAKPYAEWNSSVLAADPTSLLKLDTSGETLAELIQNVLQRAQLRPSEIGMVNAHGTATEDNDLCEASALRQVFGPDVARVPVAAQKAVLGHLLGAASSVECALTALMVNQRMVPCQANGDQIDPACEIHLPNQHRREYSIGHAVKLSLGFGGHLGAAVISEM